MGRLHQPTLEHQVADVSHLHRLWKYVVLGVTSIVFEEANPIFGGIAANHRRLGLIGHSEGGLIAPMVAAENASLRGIVLMAGPSKSGREIIARILVILGSAMGKIGCRSSKGFKPVAAHTLNVA